MNNIYEHNTNISTHKRSEINQQVEFDSIYDKVSSSQDVRWHKDNSDQRNQRYEFHAMYYKVSHKTSL